MTPTEQQKAILECRENLVVIAAPGSGKTFVLSEKIKNDIKELLDYQGIIAISYTNKASLELKNRSLANGISPKSSFFGTIDKFCIQDIIIPFGSLMQEKKTFDNLIIRSMNNSERSQLGQVEKREKIEYNHMDIILSLLEANIIDIGLVTIKSTNGLSILTSRILTLLISAFPYFSFIFSIFAFRIIFT